MSLKQWYQVLLEDNVTMVEIENKRVYIPCRVEVLHPATDWETTWRLARLPGRGSELVSFLVRLLHELLPTRERQQRITPSTPNICKLCQDTAVEDQFHALFQCDFNREVSHALVQPLLTYDNSITPEKLLKLEFSCSEESELPIVWYVASCLMNMWNFRASGKRVRLYTIRAEVESRVALLRETRYRDSAATIQEILNSLH